MFFLDLPLVALGPILSKKWNMFLTTRSKDLMVSNRAYQDQKICFMNYLRLSEMFETVFDLPEGLCGLT